MVNFEAWLRRGTKSKVWGIPSEDRTQYRETDTV